MRLQETTLKYIVPPFPQAAYARLPKYTLKQGQSKQQYFRPTADTPTIKNRPIHTHLLFKYICLKGKYFLKALHKQSLIHASDVAVHVIQQPARQCPAE